MRVRLADPLGGEAVDLEHRVADPVAAAVALEDVALAVDDATTSRPARAPPLGDDVEQVVAAVLAAPATGNGVPGP